MKKKTTKWEDFKFWLYLKKLDIILWSYNLRDARLERKHCDRGFHFFEKDYIKLTVGGAGYKKGWSRETQFQKCKVCEELIFTTEKDYKNWIFIKKRGVLKKTKGKVVVI